MVKWRIPALLAMSLLVGCVTVDGSKTNVQKDPIAIAESRIELGLGYMQQGDYARAKQNFEKAIEHAPKYYRTGLTLAYYYETVGDIKAARKAYERASNAHPNNGTILNNYGTFLCKQGDYYHADRYFNQAIKQPHYYQVSASYENAGLCALKANDVKRAENYFIKALDHQPLRPNATIQLAAIEVKNNQLKDARLRLLAFNHRYGYQKPSLRVLVDLESKAGNRAMVEKYQSLLSQ
ncbi:type IV pilus biogenesis/stability protein PilW [Vibrio methylphosphonaticus]|uniref:type IV pilus biogenesis/stability protein PilW n=1 Tax=Vibrio methylphosphonaticus TaxID=2946866 RepID=UPI002029F2B7|nr:type IV pilus biogenesis/stability protein PilW [Vibrio methylphosphonaticus]MCL9774911.1 type IV pilus biogenesis/stability protein PilW [Vibrio methylphosphonaticus]